MTDATNSRRFAVALSFPGEHRAFVEQVANHLAATFGQDRVLYDKFHEEELARLDLNIYLPSLYRKDSELIVVCLCAEYAAKLWCRLEWRHISQLIATVDANRIMFLSFGNPGDLSELGILGGDGYIKVDSLTPQTVAEKICKRLSLNLRADIPTTNQSNQSAQRELELSYLKTLCVDLKHTENYTPLGGGSQEKGARVEMRQVCVLRKIGKDGQLRQEKQPFEDAVKEIRRIKRAALLGDPGGGKTTILGKLAVDLAADALQHQSASIPLLILLREWTDASQPLSDYIVSQLTDQVDDDPSGYLDRLLREKRAALLFDGLNELPPSQWDDKYEQVRQFIKQHQHPKLIAVVSCRELDYKIDLGFSHIIITPLDPLRIREFVVRYLPEKGEALFRDLAGQNVMDTYERFLEKLGDKLDDPEQVFWLDTELPDGVHWGWWEDDDLYWLDWLSLREAPSSLMTMARNPYMLYMLASVYNEDGKLPDNRGDLFRKFEEDLLAREYKRERIPKSEREALTEQLTEGLAQVAYEMQIRRAPDGDEDKGNAMIVLPKARVVEILGKRLGDLAASASILSTGEQVRFTHQLLQEYFVAKFMDLEITAGRLKATEIWKSDRWGERTNWEEAAILLAGLYSNDCSRVVEWIAEANPEVAVQCFVRSGAALAEATKETLCDKWISRLTDLETDPEPQARAAIGRALGMLGWDSRPGVGVVEMNGVKLPDIEWIKIPEGEFQYGDAKAEYAAKPQKLWLPEFQISRFPITYSQFQTFLDDPEGFNDSRWFAGLAADEDDRRMEEQYFKFANHPRDTVNWYQAVAFCRWLTWRLGTTFDLKKVAEWAVRLPTEFEWEKAARGTDGRLYPYKGKYDPKKSNVDETGIGQTNAVGIFPNGASPDGVEEMSGNVREWCLSDYGDPKLDPSEEDLGKEDCYRVLRGGSWFNNQLDARAVFRVDYLAANRVNDVGFRVVAARPPSS